MKKTLNKVLAVLLSAVLFMSCAGAASAASISDLLMVIKLGKSQTDLVKNVVKTPVDIGISGLKTLKAIVDYKKADGDIVKSGVKTPTTDPRFRSRPLILAKRSPRTFRPTPPALSNS